MLGVQVVVARLQSRRKTSVLQPWMRPEPPRYQQTYVLLFHFLPVFDILVSTSFVLTNFLQTIFSFLSLAPFRTNRRRHLPPSNWKLFFKVQVQHYFTHPDHRRSHLHARNHNLPNCPVCSLLQRQALSTLGLSKS